MGGGVGQLALRMRMLMMRAALLALLCLTKTSALGRPGCRATKPACKRASSMAWTIGQLDAFWGGVRASANKRPPGAYAVQMAGGMGTWPVGPMPLEARDMGTGCWGLRADGEVSEDCESGRECASRCRRWSVAWRRDMSSTGGGEVCGDSQPRVVQSQSWRRGRTSDGGTFNRLANCRFAPRKCMRAGSKQEEQGDCRKDVATCRWRRAPLGGVSML